ncbi:SAV_2336 N-terminal domain-related protein [Streptomyces sp. PmtG]
MTLDRLRAALEALGPPVTPLELAEMLWLASTLPPGAEGLAPRDGTPRRPDALRHGGADDSPHHPVRAPRGPDADDPRPVDAPHPGEPAAAGTLHLPHGTACPGADADDVLVPAPQALRHELALQRALRPLKRRVPDVRRLVLDEDATAARAASDGARRRPWGPVLVPATERPLRLALVVDTGPAMNLWLPLAAELRAALQRTGAFRDIRVWYVTDLGDRVGLRAAPGRPALDPAAALDPTGRQLTLVLSDCSGPHWWAGRAATALYTWALRGPTALLQPLPERLWRRTAAPATPGRAMAARPLAPNTALRFTPHDGRARRRCGALPVPVLELAPEWLADWAALVTAAGDRPRDTAVTYVTSGAPAPTEPRSFEGDLTMTERVLRFQLAASPTAADLAAHVALSVPALPVMRLIQQRVTPGSRPSDLAEVLLSGLLEPVDPARGLYDFVPGARAALLATLPRAESLAVADLLTRIGKEIEARAGAAARFFPAVVPVAGGTGTRALGVAGKPFALVSEEALEVLRGREIRVAERPVVVGEEAGEDTEPQPRPIPAEAAALPGTSNVPRLGTFVGRAKALRRLDAELARPATNARRVVVVYGGAGMGKTALAARWSLSMDGSMSPVWWLDATSLDAVVVGLAELARELDPAAESADAVDTAESTASMASMASTASAESSRARLADRAIAWLAAHDDWLLVFDGAEKPTDISVILSRLGQGGAILVTTRRAEGWERVGTVLELGPMGPDEAADLIATRAGTGVPRKEAYDLAVALGHLPLALELAAAYMAEEGVSAGDYLMLMERDRSQMTDTVPGEGRALRLALRTLDDPLAHRVLNILAWLAPEPVPLAVLAPLGSEAALGQAVSPVVAPGTPRPYGRHRAGPRVGAERAARARRERPGARRGGRRVGQTRGGPLSQGRPARGDGRPRRLPALARTAAPRRRGGRVRAARRRDPGRHARARQGGGLRHGAGGLGAGHRHAAARGRERRARARGVVSDDAVGGPVAHARAAHGGPPPGGAERGRAGAPVGRVGGPRRAVRGGGAGLDVLRGGGQGTGPATLPGDAPVRDQSGCFTRIRRVRRPHGRRRSGPHPGRGEGGGGTVRGGP